MMSDDDDELFLMHTGRPPPESLGDEIRAARSDAKRSMGDMADHLGCRVTVVSDIELDKVKVSDDMLAAICAYLGVERSSFKFADPLPKQGLLFCPHCHKQHIDHPPWDKKPHVTHLCAYCNGRFDVSHPRVYGVKKP